MSNVVASLAGLLLIALSFISFVFALPSLDETTTTGSGTTWENASASTISNVNMLNQYLPLFPFLIFMLGIGISFAGIVGG